MVVLHGFEPSVWVEQVEEGGWGDVVVSFFLAMTTFFPVNLNFEDQAALLGLKVWEDLLQFDF